MKQTPKKIRFKEAKSFTYQGILNYLVSYDYATGKDNRYTVFILTDNDPVVIGRKLLMETANSLINNYERIMVPAIKYSFFGDAFIGEREFIQACVRIVIEACAEEKS